MKVFYNSVIVIFILLVFGVIIKLLFTADSSHEHTLKLIGIAMTALASVLGIALKVSFDEKTLKLNEQAENRLKIETEINAIKLLTTNSGYPAPAEQKSGALFALVNSDQVDFALHLLDVLKDQLPMSTLIWVLDKGLMSENTNTQEMASYILSANPDKFITDDIIGFPEIIKQYPFNWSWKTRQHICRLFINGIPKAQKSPPAIITLYTYLAAFLLRESKYKDEGLIYNGLLNCLSVLAPRVTRDEIKSPIDKNKTIYLNKIEEILKDELDKKKLQNLEQFLSDMLALKQWVDTIFSK